MVAAESTLLTTKLYRPPADATWVTRPELITRLNAGLTCKLTLISAPAGFGKTALVSQWMADFRLPTLDFGLHEALQNPKSRPKARPGGTRLWARQNPKCCWLSLDEADN